MNRLVLDPVTAVLVREGRITALPATPDCKPGALGEDKPTAALRALLDTPEAR